MKNFLVVVCCVFIFSCSKNEQKSPTSVVDVAVKDTIMPLDPIQLSETLVFTVQIAALEKTNAAFSRLKEVAVFEEDGFVKYRLGNYNTYQEARKERVELLKTYRGAFIQALHNNAPISITEALEY
jgi:hypothetical protein